MVIYIGYIGCRSVFYFSLQNQLERLLLIIVALGLFWPKFINLNPWLGYSAVNNFLDATISLGHVLALLIVISELIRLRYHYTVVCLSLLTITVWQIQLANPSLEEFNRGALTWLSVAIWLAIWFRYQAWFEYFWMRVIALVWLLYATFEHLLVSNPYPSLFVWLIFQILNKSQLKPFASSADNLIRRWQLSPSICLKPELIKTNPAQTTRQTSAYFLSHQRVSNFYPSIRFDRQAVRLNLKLSKNTFTKIETNKTQKLTVFLALVNLGHIWMQRQKLIIQRIYLRFRYLQKKIQWSFIEILLGLLILVFTFNLFVGTWQVITGTNLGWSILGEPKVSSHTAFSAKQPIGDYYLVLLRGYGLMQHPNVLGFLGVVGFWLSWINSKLVNTRKPKLLSYLRIISSIIVFLSFSRLAWLGWLIILVAKLILTKVENSTNLAKTIIKFLQTHWLVWVSVIGLMGIIFFSRIAYPHSTDWVRLQEYNYFWSTYSQLPWSQKLFGVGLGQYPFYFRSYHSWLPRETYQPMHNLLASFWLELGIVFGSLFIIYLALLTKVSNKHLKSRSLDINNNPKSFVYKVR